MARTMEKLPLGTEIRFTRTLIESAPGDHPDLLLADAGESGEIAGHDVAEGYLVKTDNWPAAFGAVLFEEFEPMTPALRAELSAKARKRQQAVKAQEAQGRQEAEARRVEAWLDTEFELPKHAKNAHVALTRQQRLVSEHFGWKDRRVTGRALLEASPTEILSIAGVGETTVQAIYDFIPKVLRDKWLTPAKRASMLR